MKFTLIALPTRHTGVPFPNLGAIGIAQTVRMNGQDVSLIDIVRYRYTIDEVITKIKELKPDLIGLSGIITSYYYFEPLAIMLKKCFPTIPIVIGGSITTAMDLIEANTEVDFLIKGEGENGILELISMLSSAQSLDNSDIPSLFVREGRKFRSPTVELSYTDLSNVSIPAYDLYDMEYYIEAVTRHTYNFIRLYPGLHEQLGGSARFFSVVITRGCPFSCFFCYRLVRKHHSPPIDNVINHISMIKEKYGCSGIYMNDELLIANKRWFIELCDAIADKLPGLKLYTGASRANLLTPELVKSAKKAGFIRLGCGIESGSQVMLNNLNKKTTVEQNINAIKYAKEAGLMVTCNMIFGCPGENKNTLRETEKFIRHTLNNPDDYSSNLANAYPGTPLWDYALNKGILKKEQIRDYILNASFGTYPLNFSDFDSTDRFCREVVIMQLRLKIYFKWKEKDFITLPVLILNLFARRILCLLPTKVRCSISNILHILWTPSSQKT